MAETNRLRTGVVVIGRNEGERLKRCLASIPAELPIVYVDSASTDGSVAFAMSKGADVVELDMRIAFSAARARNAGIERLCANDADLAFVQFVDGDCEVEPGWIERAVRFLNDEPGFAAVCGRRRERYPDRSFYNRICDEEWDTPVGEAAACGGDALFRVSAFAKVGGFNPTIIAGEEPELCHRMRAQGWRIWRLEAPMTIHDADMHHFRQWWMRAVRSGFGYAQVWQRSRRSPAPLYARELARSLLWTVGVLLFALALALAISPWALLAAPSLWALQFARLSRREGMQKAGLLLVGKFAEAQGILRFAASCLARRQQGAIFYK